MSDVQSALQQKLASLKDPLDATSDRERDSLRAIHREIEMHVNVWPGLSERLATPTARRVVVQAELARLRAVEKQLDTLIADAAKRQNALESKNALQHGCRHYENGQPMLPTLLRQLLTPPPCTACHRPHDVTWSGPIAMFEQELVVLDKEIAQAQRWIDAHLGSARALLDEAV